MREGGMPGILTTTQGDGMSRGDRIMALKALLDSLDGLPDAVKSEYTDNGDGTFKLSVEGADALVDTSGLKKTVKTLREQNATLSAWVKAFPDKTPEEIADLVKAAGTGEGKPDIAKIRKEIADAEEKKHKDVYTERDTLSKQLRSLKMTEGLSKLALKHGVFEDRVDDAVEAALKSADLDDKGNIIILDDDGEPSAKTPDQFFTDVLKTKKAWLFKAPDASGSGGDGKRPRDASSASTVKSKKDLKTDADKVAFIKKHGRKAFTDLPAE
jgi:hypothetical protein